MLIDQLLSEQTGYSTAAKSNPYDEARYEESVLWAMEKARYFSDAANGAFNIRRHITDAEYDWAARTRTLWRSDQQIHEAFVQTAECQDSEYTHN